MNVFLIVVDSLVMMIRLNVNFMFVFECCLCLLSVVLC